MEASQRTWLEAIEAYFSDYQTWLTDIVLLGGGALVAGLLVKNFGKYIIGACLIVLGTILVLNWSGFLTASFSDVFAHFGITGITSPADAVSAAWAWMQTHIVGTISMIIGFLLGWKLG